MPELEVPLKGSFFRIPAICARSIGIWPLQRGIQIGALKWKGIYTGFISITFLVLFGIISTIYLILDKNQPHSFGEFLTVFSMFVHAMNCYLFMRNGRPLKDFLLEAYDLHLKEKRPEYVAIFKEEVNHAKNISLILAISCYGISVFYTLAPFIAAVVEFIMSLGVEDSGYTFSVHVPVRPMFYITSFTNLIMNVAICAISGAFFTCCSHVAVQFRKTGYSFENLLILESGQHTLKNKQAERRLVEAVIQHYHAVRLANQVSDIFGFMIFFKFCSHAVGVAGWGYLILTLKGAYKTPIVFVLLAIFTELYALTAGGTKILTISQDISNAAYSFEWYRCNLKMKRSVIMIMRYSQLGIRIQAPFINVSLETITAILSLSISYFSLLRTIMK